MPWRTAAPGTAVLPPAPYREAHSMRSENTLCEPSSQCDSHEPAGRSTCPLISLQPQDALIDDDDDDDPELAQAVAMWMSQAGFQSNA